MASPKEDSIPTESIDAIVVAMQNGTEFIGTEDEGIVINRENFAVQGELHGTQSTQAVKNLLGSKRDQLPDNLKPILDIVLSNICPDVPESTLEMNGPPCHSPLAAIAAERLTAMIVDLILQELGPYQLLHGAAWRPPNSTPENATKNAPFWKQVYYQRQIAHYGDKITAAAGSHLNLSTPWISSNPHQIDQHIIRMTGIMRLVISALSISLSAASPLYYHANGSNQEPTFITSLSQFNSARLGAVWANRSAMDVPELWRSDTCMRRTLEHFLSQGTLLTGRDIYSYVRAQAGPVAKTPTLEEVCQTKLGLEIDNDREHIRKLLLHSFNFGPNHPDNPLKNVDSWKKIETEWRQPMVRAFIKAPRNRVELRTLESPPAFDDQTVYEYKKAIDTFLTMVFVYLSENPEMVQGLEYNSFTLALAKANEETALTGSIDRKITWIPSGYNKEVPARAILKMLLEKIKPLCQALNCLQDLTPLQLIAEDKSEPPATRIRNEIAEKCRINASYQTGGRILPNDDYQHTLLERNRASMHGTEFQQISHDFHRIAHAGDREYIKQLLELLDVLKHPPHEITPIPPLNFSIPSTPTCGLTCEPTI